MKQLVRRLYLRASNQIMARRGLQPRHEYQWEENGHWFDVARVEKLNVPNLAKHYRPAVVAYCDYYGLGKQCLLVSEPRRVARVLRDRFAGTEFITADLYTDLMGGDQPEDRPDVIWDVCLPPPDDLHSRSFDSVVCHALLEHVIAPTTALAQMLSLLNIGGHLYFQTHTPSYHKHSFPRDYVRFHHDYFEDLPQYLRAKDGLRVALCALWSREGTVCGAYRRDG